MTWVHDRIYAAGGTFVPETWGSFSDQTGIQAILHLRPEAPIPFKGPCPRQFLWLNVEDESQADEDCRLLAARFIGHAMEQGHSVLLHSSISRHRTRWAFVAYGIWRGRMVRAVLREAEEKPWLSPYVTDVEAWQAFSMMVQSRGVQP